MSSPRSALVWKLVCAVSLAANLVLALLLAPPGGKPAPAAPAKPTAIPRELQPYGALGSFLAENNHIPELKWTPAQFDAFVAGMQGTYEGRGFPMDDEGAKLREDVSRKVQALLESQHPDPLAEYFRTLREKENVLQTASGLHYRITEVGQGAPPAANATVVVSFAAQLPDGSKLAAFSRARTTVRLGELLPGLTEGIRLLSVGGKALVYLPPALSFGDKEWPAGIPRGAPLVFFVELHDVK